MYYSFLSCLDKHVKYVPYYLTFPSYNFKSSTKVTDRTNVTNCLGGGKYCPRPFYSIEKQNHIAVLKENLIQKCVYKITTLIGKEYKYFHYMNYFYNYCYNYKDSKGNNDFSIECGKAQMVRADLPSDDIEKCFADSFVKPNEETTAAQLLQLESVLDNDIFDADNLKRQEMNVRIMPSIYINGQQFWGAFEKDAILEAICSGILVKPEICYKQGGFGKTSSQSSNLKVYLLVLIIVLGISLAILVACRKYMAKQATDKLSESDIDLKVNTVVTSYLALKDKS